MHPDDFDMRAGVGKSTLGGNGAGVVIIRLKRALVSGLHVRDAIANGENFEPEFMTRSAGVGKEGKLAEIAGEIGAADAHAMGANESLAWAGIFHVREIDRFDLFDIGEFNGVRHLMERGKER